MLVYCFLDDAATDKLILFRSEPGKSNSWNQATRSMEDYGILVPPLRFGQVDPGVYRGAYPQEINVPFLKKRKLKTIISLTPDPLTDSADANVIEFIEHEQIKLIHIPTGSKKFKSLPRTIYSNALEAIENTRDLGPVYVHCLNGLEVTGILVAFYRKQKGWSQRSVIAELIRNVDPTNALMEVVENF